MKKIIILPAILLLISGCSSQIDAPGQAIQKESKAVGSVDSGEESKSEMQQPNVADSSSQADAGELAKSYKSAILKTNLGDIEVEFFGNDAPKTVDNFLKLAKSGFYDGTRFHRVIANFMIQGGDPNSKDEDWSNDGMGGPGYTFADEINDQKVVRGALAMANSGPDTNGSQFFIVTVEAAAWLDGKHTVFGRVKDMKTVDKIEVVKTDLNDHPLDNVEIKSIELVKK